MNFAPSPASLLALALALAVAPLTAGAVEPPPTPSPTPALSPGVKADMIVWIEDAEKKLLDLATATPDAKFTWRPAKGVRSVAEVYGHVIGANYNLPAKAGVKPPEGFDPKAVDKLTKKAEIVTALRESFAHAKKSLASTPDAELDKPIDLFGNKSTVRGVYLLVLAHGQEHLGQSIAYARANNITPPWTERRAAKAEGAKAEAKK
jgi:uncharacterized damage-inducible protein DinB